MQLLVAFPAKTRLQGDGAGYTGLIVPKHIS